MGSFGVAQPTMNLYGACHKSPAIRLDQVLDLLIKNGRRIIVNCLDVEILFMNHNLSFLDEYGTLFVLFVG